MSRLTHLTDEEYLLRIEDKCAESPVIAELCRRLKALLDQYDFEQEGRTECPVCEADLRGEWDSANGILSLRVNK